MARNGPERSAYRCLLLGVERTCRVSVGTSGFGPEADLGARRTPKNRPYAICHCRDIIFVRGGLKSTQIRQPDVRPLEAPL